jgi:hypothetical protein
MPDRSVAKTNMSRKLPSWVIEQSLNWRLFECCGDQDLFPFRCHQCHHIYVLCYECDTLYTDLTDLSNHRVPMWNNYSCAICPVTFDDDFMRSPRHRIPYADWHDANLDHLLVDCAIDDLTRMLAASSDQIADYLRRGMRSTAGRTMTEYRNLAESIMVHISDAYDARANGYNRTDPTNLAQTIAWYDELPMAPVRNYALLGITDKLFT